MVIQIDVRQLALWAAQPHESLQGEGFPFQMSGGDLPLELKIIKVADIYQASGVRSGPSLPAAIAGHRNPWAVTADADR